MDLEISFPQALAPIRLTSMILKYKALPIERIHKALKLVTIAAFMLSPVIWPGVVQTLLLVCRRYSEFGERRIAAFASRHWHAFSSVICSAQP
jgi:hypothetical protein